jgi:hypothetical protein
MSQSKHASNVLTYHAMQRYSQTNFPPLIDDDGDGRYSGGTPRSDKSEDHNAGFQFMSKHRTATGRGRCGVQVGEMPQLTVLSRISNGQPPTSPVLHSNSNCRRSPFWEPKHKHCALRTALARACCETPNRKWHARDSLYHSPTHLRGVSLRRR